MGAACEFSLHVKQSTVALRLVGPVPTGHDSHATSGGYWTTRYSLTTKAEKRVRVHQPAWSILAHEQHDVSASGLDCCGPENRWLTPPAEILSGSALNLLGSGLNLLGSGCRVLP